MNRKNFQGEITHQLLENGSTLMLDFEKLKKIAQCQDPVLPVIVQDADSKEVLILAYANEQALKHTIVSGLATFWSTSRNELWIKGKTSGDELKIIEIRVNCEQNSILYLVRLVGKGSCHVKNQQGQAHFGCYYRRIEGDSLVFIK